MFVILNKPHGLLVHPTDTSDEYTLRDFLIENFNISKVGEYKREGIVHRLDRVTSGLIVCPINNDCLLYTSPSPRDRTRSRMPSSA